LLHKLLDDLLVLVEALQGFSGGEGNAKLLGFVAVSFVSDQANRHSGLGFVGEHEGARETLILLGVVVLQDNLDFYRLLEVSSFSLSGFVFVSDGFTVSIGVHIVNASVQKFSIEFRHGN
jgi:hypothetical protein